MRALIVLILCSPTLASADVIMPLAGECEVGQEKAVHNHAETCVQIDCSSRACPDGSTCTSLCTCVETRERMNSRYQEMVMEDVRVCGFVRRERSMRPRPCGRTSAVPSEPGVGGCSVDGTLDGTFDGTFDGNRSVDERVDHPGR